MDLWLRTCKKSFLGGCCKHRRSWGPEWPRGAEGPPGRAGLGLPATVLKAPGPRSQVSSTAWDGPEGLRVSTPQGDQGPSAGVSRGPASLQVIAHSGEVSSKPLAGGHRSASPATPAPGCPSPPTPLHHLLCLPKPRSHPRGSLCSLAQPPGPDPSVLPGVTGSSRGLPGVFPACLPRAAPSSAPGCPQHAEAGRCPLCSCLLPVSGPSSRRPPSWAPRAWLRWTWRGGPRRPVCATLLSCSRF